VQQLRGTRKGGGVFALLFEVGFGGWKGKCNLFSAFICSSYSFCLDAKRIKKSRLIKIALNSTFVPLSTPDSWRHLAHLLKMFTEHFLTLCPSLAFSCASQT
jgi:hypothetical protein